jgi:hypothetical protein
MNRAVYWGSVLLLLAVIVGLVEAQFHPIRGMFGPSSLGHRELATQFLGEFLAAHHSGKRVVVLSNPFSTQPGQAREVYQFEKAGLRGLRRGLGNAVAIEEVAYPEIRPAFFKDRHSVPIDASTTTPLSYIVAEDALDKIAQRHPQAEILVSLIGLPVNVLRTEAWKSGRKFALLLPDLHVLGDRSSIRAAFQSGQIDAIVLNKPGAPPEDQPLGRDEKMEFSLRFLLVTPENVDQCLKAYPRLF